MKYTIKRTDKFNDQLTDIIMYIASIHSNKEALEYLDYLEKEIYNLEQFSHIGNIQDINRLPNKDIGFLFLNKILYFIK